MDDDYCMGMLANSAVYLDAVDTWINQNNSRLFLALLQTALYRLPFFSDPVNAAWTWLHLAMLGMHLAVCLALYQFFLRMQLAIAPSLIATVIFAVHPMISQPVLWPAAAIGYLLGTLLLIGSIATYHRYERTESHFWLLLAFTQALLASLGIEQFIVALGALSLLHLLIGKSSWNARHRFLPLVLMILIGAVFLAVHFLFFAGTVNKISRTTEEAAGFFHIFWLFFWWLNPFPSHSPYELRFYSGLELISKEPMLCSIITLCVIFTILLLARHSSWSSAQTKESGTYWLAILAGICIFAAPLLPFFIMNGYHFRPRVMYLPMLGIVISGGATLHLIASSRQWGKTLRLTVALFASCLFFSCIVTDLGAQRLFAESWSINRSLISILVAEEKQIREAGFVFVDGLPPCAYDEIAQLDTAWGFPCMITWVLKDPKLKGHTNLMRDLKSKTTQSSTHRIDLSILDKIK